MMEAGGTTVGTGESEIRRIPIVSLQVVVDGYVE